jgi:hypothetical protein
VCNHEADDVETGQDDHITSVLSEQQAGKELDVPATGLKLPPPAQRLAVTFKFPNPARDGAVQALMTLYNSSGLLTQRLNKKVCVFS